MYLTEEKASTGSEWRWEPPRSLSTVSIWQGDFTTLPQLLSLPVSPIMMISVEKQWTECWITTSFHFLFTPGVQVPADQRKHESNETESATWAHKKKERLWIGEKVERRSHQDASAVESQWVKCRSENEKRGKIPPEFGMKTRNCSSVLLMTEVMVLLSVVEIFQCFNWVSLLKPLWASP